MDPKHERRPGGGGALHGLAGDAGANYRDADGGATDRPTVLRSFGPALTKRVKVDGSLAPYDGAKRFGVREVVAVTMRDLEEAERATLVTAMRRSRLAARIWRGDRSYADRSKRDFAFAAGLVRGGCTSPEALAAALVALCEKHALGSKCDREDDVARTVTAVLAAQREVARG